MKTIRTIQLTILSALLMGASAPSGCVITSGDIIADRVFPVKPILVEGSLLGTLLDLTGLSLPFDQSLGGYTNPVPNTKSITLERLALRTLLPGAVDRADEALTDDSLIDLCRPGQKPITFIESISVSIQKQGQPATRKEIASFAFTPAELSRNDICGFEMATDVTVDLNQYLPHYETIITSEGTPPEQDTEIGGFVMMRWEGTGEFPYEPGTASAQ